MLRLAHTVTSMSTVTHVEPATATSDKRSGPRLASGALGRVFLFSAGLLTSFYLLLSVTPMYAASAGAGSAGAGLATGLLLLGTVAAELAASGLMKRFGYRTLLAVGVILMGAPALMQLTPGPPVMIVVASVVRGFGFGLGTVAAGVVASFLPLATGLAGNVATAGLFAQAICAMAGGWGAGRLGDRHANGGLLIPGLDTASLGMTAMIWLASPVR